MKIALASDHAGYTLKQHLVELLRGQGYDVLDLGVDTAGIPADYPDSAVAIGEAVLDERAERGILVCGSGIGACIAANKMPGIYASIAHDTYSAHQGVEHDRMNILCLGARIIGSAAAEEIVSAYLRAQPSDEERHRRRFAKIQMIEQKARRDSQK